MRGVLWELLYTNDLVIVAKRWGTIHKVCHAQVGAGVWGSGACGAGCHGDRYLTIKKENVLVRLAVDIRMIALIAMQVFGYFSTKFQQYHHTY